MSRGWRQNGMSACHRWRRSEDCTGDCEAAAGLSDSVGTARPQLDQLPTAAPTEAVPRQP